MKKTLKFTSILVSLLLAFAILPLTACKDKDDGKEAKIMNVSLNPKVEFILDKDDKVVTVNALNEEGNLIISAEAFVNVEGMSAKDAAELFVKVSKESGFLVEGSIGDNALEISITGDEENAQKLYESVKGEITGYLSSINVTVDVTKVKAYTEAELEEIVSQVCLYLSDEEIAKLNYDELIAKLQESRKETAEYYSQELKNTYYAMKSVAMQKAELNALKEHAGLLASAAIASAESIYDSAVEALMIARNALVDENGAYQIALADLRAKKVEYLNYRKGLVESGVEITETQTNILNGLEQAFNNAEAGLLGIGESANTAISNAEASLKSAFDAVISAIETLGVKVNEHLNEISAKQKSALTEFTTEFETAYASAKAKAEADWEAMYNELTEETAA
ncbi:MAG: hypothetical protein IKJ14_03190 [Clostridia bacterium]|nr:hypothetical protein [Clostridia bacterium]